MSFFLGWPIGANESDIWVGSVLVLGLSYTLSEKWARMRVSVRPGGIYGSYLEDPDADQTRRLCLLGCVATKNSEGDTVLKSSLANLSKPVTLKPCGERMWRSVFHSAVERACNSHTNLQTGLVLATLPGTYPKPTLCNLSLASNKHRPVIVLQPVMVMGLEERERPVLPDEAEGWGDIEYADSSPPDELDSDETIYDDVVKSGGSQGEEERQIPSTPPKSTRPPLSVEGDSPTYYSSAPSLKSPQKTPGNRQGGLGGLVAKARQVCAKVSTRDPSTGLDVKCTYLKVDTDSRLVEGLPGCALELTNVRTIFRANTAFGLLAYKGQGAWTSLTLRPLDLEDDDDAILLTSPPAPLLPSTSAIPFLDTATKAIFGPPKSSSEASAGSDQPEVILAPVVEPMLLLDCMRETLALVKNSEPIDDAPPLESPNKEKVEAPPPPST